MRKSGNNKRVISLNQRFLAIIVTLGIITGSLSAYVFADDEDTGDEGLAPSQEQTAVVEEAPAPKAAEEPAPKADEEAAPLVDKDPPKDAEHEGEVNQISIAPDTVSYDAPGDASYPKTNTVTASLELTVGYTSGKIESFATAPSTTYSYISYQWYSNTTASTSGGRKITGATSASYTIPANLAVGTYYYYCEVTTRRSRTGTAHVNNSENCSVVTVKALTPVSYTDPTGVTEDYSGSAIALVSAGSVTGGTMKYAVTSTTTTPAVSAFGTEVPQETNAGTYYVWYIVEPDSTHTSTATNPSSSRRVQSKINTVDTTFTTPSASDRTYDGTVKPLVTGGSATGGTLKYLSTTTSTVPTSTRLFTTTVPTARAAGTYYVWFIVEQDSNHNNNNAAPDSARCVVVTISKPDTTFTAPSAVNRTYDGTTKALVTGGSATGGTLKYLATTTKTVPTSTSQFTTTVPTATAANTYYVWFIVDPDTTHGDNNKNPSEERCVTVTVSKANTTFTAPSAVNRTYDGTTKALVTGGSATGGTLKYLSTTTSTVPTSTSQFTTTVPTARAAGTYYVWFIVDPNTNYADNNLTPSQDKCVVVTISKPDTTFTTPSAVNRTYDGTTKALVTGGSATGGTLKYLATTTKTVPTSTSQFTATVPTATAANTYYVWFIVDPDTTHGDNNKNPSEERCVTVTVSKANTTFTAPSANNRYYDGTTKVLVTGGRATGGTLKYLSTTTSTVPTSTSQFTTTVPTARTAGTYYVWFIVDPNTNYADNNLTPSQDKCVVVTITKQDTTFTTPSAVNRTYDGTTKALVTGGRATGGTLKYLATTTKTVPTSTSQFTTTVPTATAANTYYVWFIVEPDSTHGDNNKNPSEQRCVTVTVSKANTTVTAPSAVNRTYDGTAQALVTGGRATGGTLKYLATTTRTVPTSTSQFTTTVPTATDANTYYVWFIVDPDSNHNDNNATPDSTKCVTVTVSKADTTFTPPTASGADYSGSAITLVTGGSATGGTMKYAVTTDTSTPKATAFETTVPSATEAGTYYVWFIVDPDANHNDNNLRASENRRIEVKINKVDTTCTAPTANELTYDESAQSLVVAGSATGGTIKYAVTTDTTAPGASDFGTSVPTKTDAGTYYVWYIVDPDANHNDNLATPDSSRCIEVEIAQAESEYSDEGEPSAFTPGDEGITDLGEIIYDGSEQALVAAGSTVDGTVLYSLDGTTWSSDVPTASEAGEYTVSFYIKGDKNHSDSPVETISVVIMKYEYVEGANSTWVNDSTDPVEVRIARSIEDALTLDRCISVKIDDQDVPEEYLDKSSGSVIIKISADYLKTLSVGEHTLAVGFVDPYEATTKLTVKAADVPGPQTGDGAGMWMLMIAAATLTAGTFIFLKAWKKDEELG